MNSKSSFAAPNMRDNKFAKCRFCANNINFPFCTGSCEEFHPRRKKRVARRHAKHEPTPFEKWMGIWLLPAFFQMAFCEAFTSDMPNFRKSQLAPGFILVALAEVAVFGGTGITLWCIGKLLAKLIRQFQRPQYYPQERERRRRLAKERRRIKKRYTLNPVPTGEELLEQWGRVRKCPKEMIRFGSMLCDIEAYVDNSLIRNEYGEIIGRQPGIRGWLAKNCPKLHRKYKTIMRYKAMAEKFRQAFGLKDPYPAATLLDDSDCGKVKNEITVRNSIDSGNMGEVLNEKDENEITVRNDVCVGRGRKLGARKLEEKLGTRKLGARKPVRWVEEKRESVRRLFDECGISERGLLAGIDARICPDEVSAEVEQQERLRQGLPDRDGLLRKFTKVMA